MSVPKLVDPWLLSGNPIPLSQPAIRIIVAKYDPTNSGTPFTLLPNVVCQTISQNIGASPATARFRYEFGMGDEESPQTFEQALNDAFALGRVIEPDDRLVVYAQRPNDLTWIPIFYGFALGFHSAVSAKQEAVFIDAIGAVREAFDTPISGILYRDGNKVTDPGGSNIPVDIPGHFNPGGKPNCVHTSGWDQGGNDTFPVFVDTANGFAELWDLSKAARYLVFKHLEESPVDDLDLPEGEYLDELLQAQEPIDGKVFDSDDPTTFAKSPIIVADKPIDAKPWPMVVEHLVADKGFAFAWELEPTPGDEYTLPRPRHFLSLFRPQSGRNGHGYPNPPKQLWLQPRGESLDLAYTNMGSMNVTRDITEVINEWDVIGELEEWEASFVLAPAFPTVVSGVTGNYSAYEKGKIESSDGESFNKFRLFIADESGEGHYKNGSDTLITDSPCDLTDILGVPLDPDTGDPLDPDPVTGEYDPSGIRQYVSRRRPTLGSLLTQPANLGQPYKAKLSYSFDYGGDASQMLSPTGTISGGSFKLTLGANTTSDIAYNATGADVQSALAALASVGTANVYVVGGPVNTFATYIYFINGKAGKMMPDISITSSLTGGGSLSRSTLSAGGAKYPSVWDRSGTWFPITGAYTVLKDRIGIYVDCKNPNAWTVGTDPITVLTLAECLASPGPNRGPVYLRLTCAFRGDKRVKGTAEKSLVDLLLNRTVKRTVEARDRYKKQLIYKKSEFSTDTGTNKVIRDDSDAAKAEAIAMQQATRGGILNGPITIPRFTDYYKIGDRIDSINGRPLTFRTDNASDTEPIYPVIIGRTWNLEGQQTTTFQFSDANMARHSYASKLRSTSGSGGNYHR
jgi:hypothetical protein